MRRMYVSITILKVKVKAKDKDKVASITTILGSSSSLSSAETNHRATAVKADHRLALLCGRPRGVAASAEHRTRVQQHNRQALEVGVVTTLAMEVRVVGGREGIAVVAALHVSNLLNTVPRPSKANAILSKTRTRASVNLNLNLVHAACHRISIVPVDKVSITLAAVVVATTITRLKVADRPLVMDQ